MQKALQVVVEAIKDFNDQAVTAETTLDELALDSLEFVELLMEVGKRLDRDVPDEKMGDFATVGDIAKAFA